MLHLYDTRTRKAQEISPMDGKTLRFYCCGPTVYAPAHIGNFRTFIMQDVFRRVVELGGTATTHVRNLTDVDDKTIRDSRKAAVTLEEFTAAWADKFHRDCQALNCLPPHVEPSAVAHIPEQIEMVKALVEKGHAYPSEDGSVYFRISSFPEYGSLSHLDKRELDLGKTANARSNADEYEKDSVADFVLWKSRRPEDGDNYWPSPWGEGRPGWHLECSAMIHKYFGNDFDLHSGGVDLVFPHHENEVAQSRCACGGGFARLWFHIAHLLVDGGKMSKSLGNMYTLEDLAKLGHKAEAVRYVLAGGYYRRPLNFTLSSLEDAKAALNRMAKFDAQLRAAAELHRGPHRELQEQPGAPVHLPRESGFCPEQERVRYRRDPDRQGGRGPQEVLHRDGRRPEHSGSPGPRFYRHKKGGRSLPVSGRSASYAARVPFHPECLRHHPAGRGEERSTGGSAHAGGTALAGQAEQGLGGSRPSPGGSDGPGLDHQGPEGWL